MGKEWFIRTDVTREEDMAAAVDLAVSEFGRLDCMVNNAGIVGVIGSIKDTSGEDFLLDTREPSDLRCLHAAAPSSPPKGWSR